MAYPRCTSHRYRGRCYNQSSTPHFRTDDKCVNCNADNFCPWRTIYYLGAPFIILAMYNFMHTAVSLFSHSNIVLPKTLDNILRKIIVTPDFHRMHHSSEKQFTNSNYSAIFPWWDHLFGTASKKTYEELPHMEVGLEVMRKAEDNRLDKLFITPFIYKPENNNQ